MGLGYFFTSFALLTGTPIVGALLDPDDDWTKPILWSGVCPPLSQMLTHYSLITPHRF